MPFLFSFWNVENLLVNKLEKQDLPQFFKSEEIEKAIKGNECGILFESEIKIEQGDILRSYQEERKKREL